MAPIRPYWKGYLKLSLVTCPVQMMPATSESEKVKFHTLSRTTQNRVVSHYVDAITGKEVADGDEVKGYERGENEYVMLEDDELDAVALESSKTEFQRSRARLRRGQDGCLRAAGSAFAPGELCCLPVIVSGIFADDVMFLLMSAGMNDTSHAKEHAKLGTDVQPV